MEIIVVCFRIIYIITVNMSTSGAKFTKVYISLLWHFRINIEE